MGDGGGGVGPPRVMVLRKPLRCRLCSRARCRVVCGRLVRPRRALEALERWEQRWERCTRDICLRVRVRVCVCQRLVGVAEMLGRVLGEGERVGGGSVFLELLDEEGVGRLEDVATGVGERRHATDGWSVDVADRALLYI